MLIVVAITSQPTSVSQCASEETATFTVTATGDALSYQWEYSTDGSNWTVYEDGTTNELFIDSASF